MFRENALRSKVEERPGDQLPDITGGRAFLFAFILASVVAVVVAAYLCRIEVSSVAPGAIVVRGGPRAVVVEAPGKLRSLKVAAGDRVEAGQML